MKNLLIAASVATILSIPAAASATIVNVNAAVTGCDSSNCSGEHVGPGTVISSVISPVQLTLDAGSYTVTNANGLEGANPGYTAWTYNSGGANWLWSFMAIDDSNLTVLLDSLPDAGITVVGSQAEAAAEPDAVNYVGHFTLDHTTTVDFVTEDYYPPDNLGGVALNVQLDSVTSPGVPEPATWALMLLGFGGLGGLLRGSRARRALTI